MIDYRELDDTQRVLAGGGVAVHTEAFPGPSAICAGDNAVWRALGSLGKLGEALRGWLLLRMATPGRALLLNAVDRHAQWACLLNPKDGPRKRPIVLYDLFFETPTAWKRRLVRCVVEGSSLVVVFSRRQVETHAAYFRLPPERFFFVPYKSNYTHADAPPIPPGDYVFAGGNSARDYATLFRALAGTGIPCRVSATDPSRLEGLTAPPEVTIRPLREPAFREAMAGSRFVVMPLTGGRRRGHGEQTICNAMWLRRTMVAVDDLSAADYIEEGCTGFVTAPGDVEALRARMLELWNDPERCRQMGLAGRAAVERDYTYERFVTRMRNLTALLAKK